MSFLPTATAVGRQARQRGIARSLAADEQLCDIAALRSRISEAALAADETEQDGGLGWYAIAHRIALDLGLGLTTGAGILAALSPQISWVANVAAAQRCAAGADESELQSLGALGDGIRKALLIRDGASPTAVLGGRKVRSFYRNICLPDRSGAVTVDRHAVAIALGGAGFPTSAVSDKWLERSGRYQVIAAAYRAEARSFGIHPHQLQAICWLAHRRILDDKATGNLASAHRRQRSNAISDGSEDF